MQFGERVVLMQPYRDMAAGTPLIYLSHDRDSGYLVAVCIREDELYADWLSKHKVSSFQDYIKTLSEQHAAVFRNMTEHRPLDFSVVKPDLHTVKTLKDLDQALQQAQQESSRLEQIRTNFLINVGNVALDFGGEHE
jgi:hypothetical protein